MRADSSMTEQFLFQENNGGLIPTSALQLFFKEVEPKTASDVYKRWHYLKDQGFISTINFGVYYKDVLLGAISFGPPNATDLKGYWNRNTQKGWYEIKRLALSPDCPKNSESRCIAITIKLLKKNIDIKGIVTYADDGQGHVGTIYKASGFKSLGLTKAKSDFWVNGKIQQRGKTKGIFGIWKTRSRKWLFIKTFYSHAT
jgi:hypothetical protein